ncbi:MAG: hypothetical protein K6F35_06145 [Lachnospiraceae bacterium]|nr:hypothetical protein [Lachnospiraceae bacterium]
MSEYEIRPGRFSQMGITAGRDQFNIAVENHTGRPLRLDLFDRKTLKKKESILFPEESRLGDICAMTVTGIPTKDLAYRLRIGSEEYMDPYAKNIIGNERFGTRKTYALMDFPEYQFEHKKPGIPWNESVLYLLNVRSFTKDPSSNTRYPGTFSALAEKAGYLKDLGVTGVLLQPCYDFNENLEPGISGERHRNLWGYAAGHYFAPKQAYSAGDAPMEFFRMVDALHAEGIEVLLQFYFPARICLSMIVECLRYWVLTYGIDGFELMGEGSLPLEELATDPLFAETKILTSMQDPGGLFGERQLKHKNIGIMKDSFLYDARKYLKSDEDMIPAFADHLLDNPERFAVIHYLTSYQGFTLMDLVSYDRKHNEANGEGNQDGSDYNYSWNCGAEGKSRKKAVLTLRRKQIRNALAMLLLSQAVPMLRAGDEFLHTQSGNNNPYCQDNKISYLDWKNLEKHKDDYAFAKELIRFRKSHPVFRSAQKKKMMDYISCGYPDASFHGDMAWAPNFANYSRHFGVLYIGSYEKLPEGRRDGDYFVAYNMHWQNHRFHPPKPPKNKEWRLIMSTEEGFFAEEPALEDGEITVPQRSILILHAFPMKDAEPKKNAEAKKNVDTRKNAEPKKNAVAKKEKATKNNTATKNDTATKNNTATKNDAATKNDTAIKNDVATKKNADKKKP